MTHQQRKVSIQICVGNIYLGGVLRYGPPVGFLSGPRSGEAAGLGLPGLQTGTPTPRPHNCSAQQNRSTEGSTMQCFVTL